MKALDGLTARCGRDVICYGSTDRSRAWKMKRENLSARHDLLDEILLTVS